jgi:aminoglycoside phosphotransferase family enzyme
VICGTAPASRELVERHGGGLASDGSLDNICKVITSFVGDANRAKEMGDLGRVAAQTEYTTENVLKKHLAIWSQLRTQRGNGI